MKAFANLLGILGLLWLAYFWLAVLCYPRARFPTPHLNNVIYLSMAAAGLCAFAGKIVSKRWWAGVALGLLTTLAVFARVR